MTVTNVGERAGATVAQLYATSPQVKGREVPRRRLVGFRRTAELAPGASQRLTIKVPLVSALRLWDPGTRRSFVPRGRWRLTVSTSATHPVKTRKLRVTGRIPRTVTRLVLDPVNAAMAVGDTQNLLGPNPMYHGLAPALADPGDRVLEAVRADDSFRVLRASSVRFTSSDPAVARVDPDGTLRAISSGAVTITATVAGVTATAPIVVR